MLLILIHIRDTHLTTRVRGSSHDLDYDNIDILTTFDDKINAKLALASYSSYWVTTDYLISSSCFLFTTSSIAPCGSVSFG